MLFDLKSPLHSPSHKVITGMVRNNPMCEFNFTLSCFLMIPSKVLMYMLTKIEVKTEAQKEVMFFCEKTKPTFYFKTPTSVFLCI